MVYAHYALSILFGAVTGLAYYGLSCLMHRKGPFSLSTINSTPNASLLLPAIMSTGRLIIISIIFYLILRLPYINPILVVLSFICVFWSLILGKDLKLWNRLKA